MSKVRQYMCSRSGGSSTVQRQYGSNLYARYARGLGTWGEGEHPAGVDKLREGPDLWNQPHR